MTFSLRRAVLTDAPAIGRVHTASWRESYSEIMSPEWMAKVSDAERIARWTVMLARGDKPWVATVDGAIVGFAASGPARDDDPPRPLELYSIYLLRKAQGLGIGHALLEAAIGDEPAIVNVLARNEKAIAFYRRHGFEPDGHSITLGYWEDVVDIRMVR